MLTFKRLESGYWHICGDGPCEWAQVPIWPCSVATLRAHAFPEASEAFIDELRPLCIDYSAEVRSDGE